MKSNNFGYLLKEGIRGIFLHGFMSFAAVCVTVACLVIIGSFSVLLYNLNIMVAEVEQDAEILVYIDESFTEAEAKSVGSKINMIENVHQATFVSRQQALEEFVAKQGDESAFQGIQADVLRDRFLVTLEDNNKMKETVPMIEAVSGVAEVNGALPRGGGVCHHSAHPAHCFGCGDCAAASGIAPYHLQHRQACHV